MNWARRPDFVDHGANFGERIAKMGSDFDFLLPRENNDLFEGKLGLTKRAVFCPVADKTHFNSTSAKL